MSIQKTGLISRSWVVFLHAILISFESVAIEALTINTGISPLNLAAIAIPISGAILAGIARWRLKGSKELAGVFRAWKHLIASAILLAAGLFTWYDSIDRVGAAKEGLLAGPLETVFILLLARIFLKERLRSVQLLGVSVAIAGFFLTVASGESGVGPLQLSVGDYEAMLSAVSFGAGIIVVTRMTDAHGSIAVTSAILMISGLVLLVAAIPASGLSKVAGDVYGSNRLPLILLFSLLPLSAAATYVVGLARIGASLTSTIGSFSIIVIVLIQLSQRAAGYSVLLPDNIAFALGGGGLAVLGIYLIHTSPRHSDFAQKDRGVATRPPL